MKKLNKSNLRNIAGSSRNHHLDLTWWCDGNTGTDNNGIPCFTPPMGVLTLPLGFRSKV